MRGWGVPETPWYATGFKNGICFGWSKSRFFVCNLGRQALSFQHHI